ncbi:MAG TPA: trypsin-like peptidase domain-containing protein [Actinomycetes bacterium]|nr:trypsin-like peptidase domain-containing protein [Actinomycetes bacterium]
MVDPQEPWGRTPRTRPARRYVFEPRQGRTGLSLRTALVMSLVVGLVAGALAAVVTLWLNDRAEDIPGLRPTLQPASEGRPPSSRTTEIADVVVPTVVALAVSGGGQVATGSGFVVDSAGYIATNNHVVSAAGDDGTIVVTFSSGQRARATIVGRSPTYDLAVLKVDVDELSVATFGDSDQVKVGDPVVAVGAPLGLTGTVTSGIVSALDRPVTTSEAGEASYISAIQTDAAINPGNSGGPLVDGRGHVIGIATSIATLSGDSRSGNIGLGFAIPMNKARTIVQQLISDGEAEYPVVGVLLDLAYRGPGARIQAEGQPGEAVTSGGPADVAGMEPGDLVVAVDGDRIGSPEEFVVQIRSRLPGDEVKLTVVRNGERFVLAVTLEGTVG